MTPAASITLSSSTPWGNYCRDIQECGGHYLKCLDGIRLRVGCKPGRAFDIKPWGSNPVEDVPCHVRDHDTLLLVEMPAQILCESAGR